MKRPGGRRNSLKKQYAAFAAGGDSRKSRLIADSKPASRAKLMGYSDEEISSVPSSAVMGLGCGNPTALAELAEGEIVLDLGAGGGLDAFLAARRVGPAGKVIGVDMTPVMVKKARQAAAKGGYANVDFRIGEIEHLPIADQSVDVVISNCVMNHCPDKATAFKEVLRVMRPTGRMHVADLVIQGRPPPPDTPGLDIWADWLALAADRQTYLRAIRQAGFSRIVVVQERPFASPAMVEPLVGKILSLQVRAYP